MSGGVSATVGYSSCCDERASRRGSPDLSTFREEGLTVRKRRARRKAVGTRAPILVEARPNARWSLDFAHDQFANGRRLRILNIVDDVTKESWEPFRIRRSPDGVPANSRQSSAAR
jgi:hypothetical protein